MANLFRRDLEITSYSAWYLCHASQRRAGILKTTLLTFYTPIHRSLHTEYPLSKPRSLIDRSTEIRHWSTAVSIYSKRGTKLRRLWQSATLESQFFGRELSYQSLIATFSGHCWSSKMDHITSSSTDSSGTAVEKKPAAQSFGPRVQEFYEDGFPSSAQIQFWHPELRPTRRLVAGEWLRTSTQTTPLEKL